MKTSQLIKTLLLIFLIMTVWISFGQTKTTDYDSTRCLKIHGQLLKLDRSSNSCTQVELLLDNTVIDSLKLPASENKFSFLLYKNKFYSLRIIRPGYLDKIICVNTEVPSNVDGIYRFRFKTQLLSLKVAKRLNQDPLDFPVAIIHYDLKLACFDYNRTYSAMIKQKTHELRNEKGESPDGNSYVLNE